MGVMIVQSPDLEEHRALAAGVEVEPRVAGVELHKVQFDQKHLLDLAEMIQAPQVVA